MNLQSNIWWNTITTHWNQEDLSPLAKKFLLVSVSALFIGKAITSIIGRWKHHTLIQKADRKRQERDQMVLKELESLPPISQKLTDLVLNAKVFELSKLLNEDKVTSEEILVIYHRRAVTHGLRFNLIAESNFKEALELARGCDQIRKITPKEERHKLGVMFGIPISIKDSIEQKGLDSTCGAAQACFKPYKEDGQVISLIKAQGAIPFIRTNLSQILRVFDCENHVWGHGVNPWNTQRAVGGSSGGCGGMVAARCSPISLGSDMYGSIRIPSAFAGVYGIRPTCGRYVKEGHTQLAYHNFFKFCCLTHETLGPLGRCTEDLKCFIQGMITPESRQTEPSVPFVPWNEEKYLSKGRLKIGYVTSEEFFPASEPSQRAVREAVQALRKKGHEVVEIEIPHFEELALLVTRLLFVEGDAQSLKSALGDEKPIQSLGDMMKVGETSNMTKRVMKVFSGERMKKIIDNTMELPVNETILYFSKLGVVKEELIKWWGSTKLDAIVLPPCALPAFKHNYGAKLVWAACYLWIGSMCNMPSGVVPITKVREDETRYSFPKSKYGNDLLSQYSEDCMRDSAGLPVGVQVLGLPWQDETCLRVMREIEEEVRFYEHPNI